MTQPRDDYAVWMCAKAGVDPDKVIDISLTYETGLPGVIRITMLAGPIAPPPEDK